MSEDNNKFNEESLENVAGGGETEDDEYEKKIFAWIEKNKEKLHEEFRKIREQY